MEPSSYPMSSTESLPMELQVHVARGFTGRLRGLIGRALPAPGCALLLPGVQAVHGFGMRDAIDVLFLDGRGCIVRVASLAPGMVASCTAARHVLEMRSGEVTRLGLRPAMRPRLLLLDDIFEEAGGRDLSDARLSAWRILQQPRVRRMALVATLLLIVAFIESPARAALPGELEAAVASASRAERAASGDMAHSSNGGGRRGSPAVPVRPVSIEALQRLEAEAEIIYRENRRDSDEALVEVYETLAELAPDRSSRAWLRIGNIRQRAGQLGEAADAYRRVRGAAEERKALLNLTALTLEDARQALARLDALPPPASPKPGAEASRPAPGERGEHALIGDLQRQLQAAEHELIERQQRRSGVASGEREPAHGAHMIERYTASARRNAVKAARGSLHVDPADELIAKPVPPPRSRPAAESLPSVEYLLGDPLRSRQNGANEREAPAAASAAGIKGGIGKAAAPASAGEGGGRAADPVRGGSQK